MIMVLNNIVSNFKFTKRILNNLGGNGSFNGHAIAVWESC